METESLSDIRIATLVINQRNNTEIIPSIFLGPIDGKNTEFQKLILQNNFFIFTKELNSEGTLPTPPFGA